MDWEKFSINRPDESPITGELRHMGLSTYVYFLTSAEDEFIKIDNITKLCTKNISVDYKEWDFQVSKLIADKIIELTAQKFPQNYTEFNKKNEEAKKAVTGEAYSAIEAYICACFGLKPNEVDDLEPNEIFRKYQQSCFIFPERPFIDPSKKEHTKPTENDNQIRHYCTACKRDSKICLRKDQHRVKDWVRTN